jgi:putative colanic acid biosynthesis glycosyltransferase WcaI
MGPITQIDELWRLARQALARPWPGGGSRGRLRTVPSARSRNVMDQPVLIVTRHYAPEPTGSAPVITEMSEWLARAGHAVEVLTVRPSYPERRIVPGYERGQRDRAVEAGVSVRRLPTAPPSSDGLLARVLPELGFFFDLTAGRLLGRFPTRQRVFSLCPSVFTVAGAIALVGRGGHHTAVVHDIPSGLGAALGLGQASIATRLLRAIEAWTLNHVDQVVTLSEAMATQLRAIGVVTPITILPPHVDTARVHPLARQHNAPPTVMYSGNLGRKQGLEQLADLALVLRRRAPDIRFLIRGEGAGKAALAARLHAEGLNDVLLEPLAPVNALSASLAEGDVHLVPQLAAGADFAVPSKIFAIMAAGRPLVATALPGSPLDRLAVDSAAFVCTPLNDPEAFAEAVLQLMGDPERRQDMGAKGRAYVEAHASTEVCMEQLMGKAKSRQLPTPGCPGSQQVGA